MKILFPGGVKQRVLEPEVNIVGRYDANPMLYSMIYEVELPGVQLKDNLVNVIS